MSGRLAAHRPPPIRNLPARTRRCAIGTAAVIPALLIGVLGSTGSGAPQDSGLVACAYPLATQDVPAADYNIFSSPLFAAATLAFLDQQPS